VFLEAYGVDTEAVAATSAVARPHPSHAHRDGIRPNHRLRRSSIPRRSVKQCNHFRAREHPAITQSLSATTTPGRDDQPDPPRSPPQRPAHTVGWRCRHHHHADVAALQVADQQSRCCGVWHRAEFGGRPPTPPRQIDSWNEGFDGAPAYNSLEGSVMLSFACGVFWCGASRRNGTGAPNTPIIRRASPRLRWPRRRRWRGTATMRCRTCWCAGCFRRDVRPQHFVLTAESFGAAVRAGLGWGIYPEQLAGPALVDGSFMRISDAHLDVSPFWQYWKINSPIVKTITDTVRSAAAGLRRPRK
jgi:hypothetical protein